MKKFSFIPLITFITIFFSCSNENEVINDVNENSSTLSKQGNPPPPPYIPTLYAAGIVYNSNGNTFVNSWGGISMYPIQYPNTSSTDYSRGNSVFVYNGSVYVAGKKVSSNGNFPYVATIWKNGQVYSQPQTPAPFHSEASSVFINNNNTYIAGNINYQAVIWINGSPTTLSLPYNNQGSIYGFANSVFVSGNDVYVAGEDGYKAKLWVNGVPISLSTVQSSAKSVFKFGSDIYIAGNEYNNGINIAKYWKVNSSNSVTSFQLSNGLYKSEAVSIAVSTTNGDIYVCGYENNISNSPTAKLWKNGIPIPLSSFSNTSFSKANSLSIYGNDVYVGGSYLITGSNIKACVWTNGVITDYNVSDATEIYSIKVQ